MGGIDADNSPYAACLLEIEDELQPHLRQGPGDDDAIGRLQARESGVVGGVTACSLLGLRAARGVLRGGGVSYTEICACGGGARCRLSVRLHKDHKLTSSYYDNREQCAIARAPRAMTVKL